MKPVKKLAVLGLTLASVFTLAACGNSNSGASKTYSYVYLTDPDTLDYTNTEILCHLWQKIGQYRKMV